MIKLGEAENKLDWQSEQEQDENFDSNDYNSLGGKRHKACASGVAFALFVALRVSESWQDVI